jgi:hypothetical protein
VYFNSSSYKNKVANKSMQDKVFHLNKFYRNCILEGVYTFEHFTNQTETIISKFGDNVEKESRIFIGDGDLSFRSNRIIILFQGEREEILLGIPYIESQTLSDKFITYVFPIINWSYTNKNNENHITYDSNKLEELKAQFKRDFSPPILRLTVYVKEGDYRKILNADLRIGGSLSIGGFDVFQSSHKAASLLDKDREPIQLQDIKQREIYERPQYADCGYEPIIYDLDNYAREFKIDSKNPFLINKYWRRIKNVE